MQIGRLFVIGFFAAIIAGIVFVQAQALGKESGGAQTADIINAAGGSLSDLGSSLESGKQGSRSL